MADRQLSLADRQLSLLARNSSSSPQADEQPVLSRRQLLRPLSSPPIEPFPPPRLRSCPSVRIATREERPGVGNSRLPQPPGESRARPGWRPSPFRDGSRLTFSATLRGAEGRPRGCPSSLASPARPVRVLRGPSPAVLNQLDRWRRLCEQWRHLLGLKSSSGA